MSPKRKPRTPAPPLAPVPDEILDQFVGQGPLSHEELDAAVRRFKKAIIERALGGELTHHLGYPPGGERPETTTNHRNGTGPKTVLTDDGPLAIDIPRDRDGSFEPRLIGKHERRFTGFDDKILALYARGMTVREIQAFLLEMYAVEVSPDFISTVTDAVLAEVAAWQSRPLEPMYPVVFFDALRVKIRDEATVRSKAIYLALAVLPDGSRDILGLWIEQTEGAKFWMKVFSDLKTRGCQDILIAVTDGLKGMPEALAAIYPQTTLQTCNRASDPSQPRLCQLEGAEADGGRAADDLRGPERRRRGRCARGLRPRAVGHEISDRRGGLAAGLDARDPVLRLPARGAARDLHHERARKRPQPAAQDHQNAWALSQRRGRDEADLARPAEHHKEMGARRADLAPGDESVCDSLRGSLYQAGRVMMTAPHTKFLTRPR
jgi:putative transposase